MLIFINPSPSNVKAACAHFLFNGRLARIIRLCGGLFGLSRPFRGAGVRIINKDHVPWAKILTWKMLQNHNKIIIRLQGLFGLLGHFVLTGHFVLSGQFGLSCLSGHFGLSCLSGHSGLFDHFGFFPYCRAGVKIITKGQVLWVMIQKTKIGKNIHSLFSSKSNQAGCRTKF